MLDVEPVITAELERLAAGPVGDPDWSDVVARAATPSAASRGQRTILIGVAAAFALLLVAVAVAATFGGFRTWLTGEPGRPASARAQAAFDRATRSWRGFPRSTSLRQLVVTDVDGVHYELDGFRGAGSLCLRLVVSGAASGSRLACAPVVELKSLHSPALVMATDTSLGDTGKKVNEGPITLDQARAAVTFGVLADGVDQILVTHQTPSKTRTFVSGDAFLAVSPRLSPFNATTRIVAAAGGTRAAVRFAPAGTPFSAPPTVALPSPTGPAKPQRVLKSGAIHWFAKRQARGVPVPAGLHHIVGASPDVIFARMITPDSSIPERMVVSLSSAGRRYFSGRLPNNRQVCAELVGGRYRGGGCWPAGRLFTTAPFTVGMEVQAGGQVIALAGLADDDVAKLKSFSATGTKTDLALHDNGFVALATLADFPLRLVAYDRSGLIIGVTTFNGPLVAAPPFPSPAPGAHWKQVLHNTSGSIWIIRSTTGGTCLGFHEGGGTAVGCGQPVPNASGLSVSVGSDRSHSYVQGLAGSKVTKLKLTLRSGHVIVIAPIHRYVLYQLATSALRDPSATVKTIEGLDASGRVIARQRG